MSERKARIDLTNLPMRPRPLKHDELQNVFGGCSWRNGYCQMDSDCCQTGVWAERLACLGTGPMWPWAGICG